MIGWAAVAVLAAVAADPQLTVWMRSADAGASPGLRQVLPGVHSVVAGDRFVAVRSAGLSLQYLGPLQLPPAAETGAGEFVFRIPRAPRRVSGERAPLPVGVVGVFASGVPVYNLFARASYQDAGLWRFDPVRGAAPSPAVERWLADGSRHSPVIGYALDGFPIYGPWGFANADGSGGVRRMRSGYRLRKMAARSSWADGTVLTGAQAGPAVSAEYPLGTFAEDYEFAGAGDLDAANGRFAVTPEYPQGTYAYFLSTGLDGGLAFPYLLGEGYAGAVEMPAPLPREMRSGLVTLRTDGARLSFAVANATGRRVRRLETVHERPMHVLVVSRDLAEFAHIHPELQADGSYEVRHSFAHGGRYRVYADLTAPGSAQTVEHFDIEVAGPPRAAVPLRVDRETAGLRWEGPLRAGEDVAFSFAPPAVDGLQPYLGAWAHFIVIGEGLDAFIHAHPLEAATHSHENPGPAPDEIRFNAVFPQASLYKVWAQYQRNGEVMTVPYVLRVGEAAARVSRAVDVPRDAVRVEVGPQGFTPSRVEVAAGQPVTLAVTRSADPNCGSRIVIPSLKIERDLPLGETVVLPLPPLPAGEIRFACGMGMYKGMLVAVSASDVGLDHVGQ